MSAAGGAGKPVHASLAALAMRPLFWRFRPDKKRVEGVRWTTSRADGGGKP
jgi:hypothetical protein